VFNTIGIQPGISASALSYSEPDQEDLAVETASIQTKPTRLRVEDWAVKITLFSGFRGGGRKFV